MIVKSGGSDEPAGRRGTRMYDFARDLAAWQPFFITLAGVCATLAGLLFVALSLHAANLRAAENANLRRLAQHTFGDFILVLFTGLFFIIPGTNPAFLGAVLLMLVVVASRQFPDLMLQALRDHDTSLHRQYLIRRLGLSLLARVLLLCGAFDLYLRHTNHIDVQDDMIFVFSGSASLVISSTRNAWFLLVHELG